MSGLEGIKDEAASEWGHAGRVLIDRVVRPLIRPGALFYCWLCVMVIGGAGVWISLVWLVLIGGDLQGLIISHGLSVLTYGLALAATCITDAALGRDVDRPTRIIVTFLGLALCGGAIWCLTMWWRESRVDPSGQLVFSWKWFVASMFAWWGMWWLANASDDRFRLSPAPNSAAGGDPLRELSG